MLIRGLFGENYATKCFMEMHQVDLYKLNHVYCANSFFLSLILGRNSLSSSNNIIINSFFILYILFLVSLPGWKCHITFI